MWSNFQVSVRLLISNFELLYLKVTLLLSKVTSVYFFLTHTVGDTAMHGTVCDTFYAPAMVLSLALLCMSLLMRGRFDNL